jgi:uncharacterized lipoprotein YddW (UPF0748 family)
MFRRPHAAVPLLPPAQGIRVQPQEKLRMKTQGWIAAAVVLAAACSPHYPETRAESPPPAPAPEPEAPAAPLPEPPAIAREFRAVWVASVSNIDWPSRRDLPVAQQQAELVALLDRAAELRMNAVIFQVRPGGDALYASTLEPWSEYLTGEMGRPPEPFWDPLAFAVAEAHRRGLELHAWFNPYRARHPSARGPVSRDHISRTRPELVRSYGSHLWMDPGEAAVREHTLAVILDVVRRYDVHGVHIDDYFYPYQERDRAGRAIPFPDDPSWNRYRAGGGALSRNDWRRDNVDRLVEAIYAGVKAEKPWVKFGISPFGIWRPGHPAGVTGLDAYSALYADARKWLVHGWLDYFTPQLYWRVDKEGQRYPLLLGWWADQNVMGRHLWPGNFTSRVGATAGESWASEELMEQIRLTRAHAGAGGNVHFSMRSLMRNPAGLTDALREAYAEPALVPASPWLGDVPPPAPEVALRRQGETATLALRPVAATAAAAGAPWLWVVQLLEADAWRTEVLPGWHRDVAVGTGVAAARVLAVDRLGNTSEARLVPAR